MDRSSRHASGPLGDWYALLRRYERLFPDHPRIGRSRRPADDAVRLAHPPSLAFPPTAVAQAVPCGIGRVRVSGRVLGLWGPQGALPLHLTEYALERRHIHRDTAIEAFADTFHHRMLGMFYRAWAESQPCAQADRPADDAFAFYVDALSGAGGGEAPVSRLARFAAGRFTARTMSAEGLVAVVTLLLALPVSVEECVPGRLALDEAARFRLGRTALGREGVLGRAVNDASSRFRLHVGPMDFDRYVGLFPESEAFATFVSLVHRYTGGVYRWDVRLRVAARSVPPSRLSGGARLGLSTWLGATLRRDPDDLVVEPSIPGSHAEDTRTTS